MAFSKQLSFNEGYTLLEVLVSVGVVLTLGMVALPAVGKLMMVRDDVSCLSNLRQIGLGILDYAQENNGVLPGPLQAMQYPWWPLMGFRHINNGDPTQLASYVQPYLALKKTSTKWNGDDVFVCPAFKKAVKVLGDSPVYALNIRVRMGEDLQEYPPFGYPCESFPGTFKTSINILPLRLVNLSEIRDTKGLAAQSSTWLMMDADQENERFQRENADLSSLTPLKVHVSHRNALFFDFHVARIDQDTRQ